MNSEPSQLYVLLPKILLAIACSVFGSSLFALEGFSDARSLPPLLASQSRAVHFFYHVSDRGYLEGLGTGFKVCRSLNESPAFVTVWHNVEKLNCHLGCYLMLDPDPSLKVNIDFTLNQLSSPSDRVANTYDLIYKDIELDLAVLKPRGLKLNQPCLALEKFRAPTLEEPVHIIGFPYLVHRPAQASDRELVKKRFSNGALTSLRHTRHVDSLIVDADALPGNSGSPVFSEQGDVLGIVHAIYTPDDIPHTSPDGFEVIPYGGITLMVPGNLLLLKIRN